MTPAEFAALLSRQSGIDPALRAAFASLAASHRVMTDAPDLCAVCADIVDPIAAKLILQRHQPCAACGSDQVSRGHHAGNALAPECDYNVCDQCGHQWGHE
jgi:hypothetical protein